MVEINLFSFLAIVTAVYFCMLIQQRVRSKKDKQNLWTIFVMLTLAWWNFCDAFFYVAQTKETAWLWHRMGALGWCGFIAVTGYYFLVFTGTDVKMKLPAKVAYWIPPILLTLRFMFFIPSPMAEDLIQSTSGQGWTFVQDFQTIWTYIFLAYLLLYMGGPLLKVYFWQKKLTSRSKKKLANGFVVLDTVAVVIGFVSIFVLPYFTPLLPPAGCLATLVFGVWYWGWLRDYDFLYVELALNPGFVFETCIDAMLVADEDYNILYANQEAKKLLGEEYPNGRPYLEFFDADSRKRLEDLSFGDDGKAVLSNLEIQNGMPVICSVTGVEVKRGRFKIYVISLKEISQLRKAQDRLDYLAHYDELTGLVNRRRLEAILQEWEALYAQDKEDFELIFLDLSKFKQINDTFGHEAGDRALVSVAEALRRAAGQGDVLARFAGDEFIILHKEMGNSDRKTLIKEAIRQIDCTSFAPGFQMDADLGSCRYSEVENIGKLYRTADKRMYENKKVNYRQPEK